MKKIVRKHTVLEVYRRGFAAAMSFFESSRSFPMEERYSLIDQGRRATRSVCANITEAWRKRRYPLAFISKLSDAEAEVAESQTWLEFSVKCGYLSRDEGRRLYKEYDEIIAMIVSMIVNVEKWKL